MVYNRLLMADNPTKPAAERVEAHLRALIDNGNIGPGEVIPGSKSKEIQATLGVGHHDVVAGRKPLTDEGLITHAGRYGSKLTGDRATGLTVADEIREIKERLTNLENG